MKEFKGTPGPWIASKSDRSIGPVIKDDDQSYGMILPVAWVEFDGKPGHQEANANLISAAPELFSVLQKIVESGYILPHLKIESQRVIAKALGESQ